MPKQTTKYFKKQFKLWRGEVTIFQILRKILTPANPKTKSEQVSKYTGFDDDKNKYNLDYDWIESMYKHKFPKLPTSNANIFAQ